VATNYTKVERIDLEDRNIRSSLHQINIILEMISEIVLRRNNIPPHPPTKIVLPLGHM
jgi:hypothetical protein